MGVTERTGPDRCPGVVTLHPAIDGGLGRVRLPGGRVSAAGLRAIAEASTTLGNGIVDITVRANIQLRGLPAGAGPELGERFTEAGLMRSTDNERARNILANPLTGRDERAVLDADPIVTALDRLVSEDPRLRGLSGRFAFLVEDGSSAVAATPHDLALTPAAGGLALLVAGRDAGLRIGADRAAAIAATAAGEFLAARATSGSQAWRIAELPGGADAVIASARREGLTAGAEDAAPDARLPEAAAPGPAGPVTQTDGRVALAAVPPLGRMNLAALVALADACAAGAGEVRVSVWRTVVIRDLESGVVPEIAAALEAGGLDCAASSPWLGLSACAGAEGCDRALADVRAAARERARTRRADDPPEHHSACARRCGTPAGRVVAITTGGTD